MNFFLSAEFMIFQNSLGFDVFTLRNLETVWFLNFFIFCEILLLYSLLTVLNNVLKYAVLCLLYNFLM